MTNTGAFGKVNQGLGVAAIGLGKVAADKGVKRSGLGEILSRKTNFDNATKMAKYQSELAMERDAHSHGLSKDLITHKVATETAGAVVVGDSKGKQERQTIRTKGKQERRAKQQTAGIIDKFSSNPGIASVNLNTGSASFRENSGSTVSGGQQAFPASTSPMPAPAPAANPLPVAKVSKKVVSAASKTMGVKKASAKNIAKGASTPQATFISP